MSIVTLNNRALKDATAVGTTTGLGNLVFISRSTASSSSSLSFTSGIDNTYKEYIFFINNMHGSADDTYLTFNLSADGGSNYNVTKTSTAFKAYHEEAGNYTGLRYETSDDLAQSTGYQYIGTMIANAGDDTSLSAYLHLFDPSNTTFVKHFISRCNLDTGGAETESDFVAGYCNVTAAIDGVDFKFSSGNIDSGVIKMYGLSKS